ncbi:MAG TPA: hypothetical protein VHJ20_17390 [Polyangia bacterium]|nr:hypothetical protein [Polyangia bacterium]
MARTSEGPVWIAFACAAVLACSSPSQPNAVDGGGGASGAGGMAGADGGAGHADGSDAAGRDAGDGAAGHDGDAADVADVGGPDALDAADAGDADDGSDADVDGGCNVTASYGPINFAAGVQAAVAYGGTDGQTPDEVDWDAPLNTDALPDILDIALINGGPPFDDRLTTGTFDLTGQDDFHSCDACVLLIAHADPATALLKSGDDYIATSGTLTLSALPVLPLDADARITGTLKNVVFKHVTINPGTSITKLVDDCQIKLASATFDAVVHAGQ